MSLADAIKREALSLGFAAATNNPVSPHTSNEHLLHTLQT